MAHAAKELHLVLLYLLPAAPAVALLPAGQVPVHVPGDEPEASRYPMHDDHPAGAVRLTRRRKAESHLRTTSLPASRQTIRG